MSRPSSVLAFACMGLLVGCDPDPVVDGPDGPGICCPIEISPTTPCGCWRIGGYARSLSECRLYCDGANFSELTDAYGCTYLENFGLGSCLPEPDTGGPDAPLPDLPDASGP